MINFKTNLVYLKDFITIISSIIIAFVAVYGVTTWKKQLKGQTEYSLARKLLIMLYKTRNAVEGLRSIFLSSGEILSALAEAKIEIDPNIRITDPKYTSVAYNRRWKSVLDAYLEYQVESFEAEALWGENFRLLVKELNHCIKDLYYSMIDVMQYQQIHDANPKDEYIISQEKILYARNDKEDEFQERFNKLINEFEIFLRPYINI